LPRLDFCPLTAYNPGLLLAFSLDIIPREDIFTLWGCQTVHCAGDVEQRMKPLPTFFVSVKHWLHLDMRTCAPSSWRQRTLRVNKSGGHPEI